VLQSNHKYETSPFIIFFLEKAVIKVKRRLINIKIVREKYIIFLTIKTVF